MKVFGSSGKGEGLGRLLICAALLLLVPCAGRAVEISEVCSNNVTAYTTAYGDCPDWIELYNPTAQAVDLSEYWISNDEDHPRLYSLKGRSIEANGYLILLADKRDLPFKLSASGCDVILTFEGEDSPDALAVPPLECDMAYARQESGEYQICEATPLAANAKGYAYQAPVYVATPAFSMETGFYQDEFELDITCGPRDTVYYTTDGSIPGVGAQAYTGALTIRNRSNEKNVYSAYTNISFNPVERPNVLLHKATVVRAVAVDPQGNRSKVVTNTYFIGLSDVDFIKDMPVLSLVSDPADLFDAENGIYMLGTPFFEWQKAREEEQAASATILPPVDDDDKPANFNLRGKLYEIPVNVQYLDADRALKLKQDMGLRIRGNYSRAATNKSLQLFARGEYGGGSIAYEFWPDAGKVDQLILRNGGNDQSILFRDAFAHVLLEPLGIPISRAIPCLMFMDGEFWGLYNIREKQNADYIAKRCNVYADDVILIKNREVDEGYGDEKALYDGFIGAISRLDCALPEDYEAARQLMDMDNYITYMAASLYIECSDWINFGGNNISLWRTRERGPQASADTRWRWIFQDLDHSSGWGTAQPSPAQSLLYEPLFSSLWPSPQFREQFLTTLMDIANITCDINRVNAILDGFYSQYRQYADINYKRFSYDFTLSDFDSRVKAMREFYGERPREVAREFAAAFSLDRQLHTLKLELGDDSLPAILLNEQAIPFKGRNWSGIYFSDCKISLEAEDVVGYAFSGWYENGQLLSDKNSLTIELDADREITPVYAQKPFSLIMNAANPPTSSSGGAISLRTGRYQHSAMLLPDEGLSAAIDGGAIVLTPEGKWSKRLGAQLSFATVGRKNLTAQLSVRLDADAPDEWRLLYSTDGANFIELTEDAVQLNEGDNALSFALPDALTDLAGATLRFETARKQFGSARPRVILSAICVSGDEMDVSLAQINQCIELCKRRMGASFTPPKQEALQSMSLWEVDQLMHELYTQLAAFIAAEGTRAVSQADIASCPALEGTLDKTLVEITPEACEYASEIAVSSGEAGAFYLYRVSEGRLEYVNAFESAEGRVVVPAVAGEYVLLGKPIEQYRYSARISSEPIDEALIESAFEGRAPSGHLWLTLERLTKYQEEIEFSLEGRIPATTLNLYLVDGEELSPAAELSEDASGAFIATQLDDGRYLALREPLELYQQYAKLAAQTDEHTGAQRAAGIFSMRNIAIAAAILALIAIAAAALIRAKRRKKND